MQLNIVVYAGRLVRDPELRYTKENTPVCNFTVAWSRTYKSKGGEGEEKCFLDCVIFGRRGEVICEYFKKGTRIVVYGRLVLDQRKDTDGNTRSRHRLNVDNFEFVDPKPKDEHEAPMADPLPKSLPKDDDIPF